MAHSSTPLTADFPAAIAAAKATLRARIGDYRQVFAEVAADILRKVAEVVATRAAGEAIWPVAELKDILDGTVPAATRTSIRQRGCAVVRQTFSRGRAEKWDAELVDYLEQNHFAQTYRYLDDGVFGGLAHSRPSIYPIYWSKPQMEAREDPSMVLVRSFLNGFWKHESEDQVWFDPDVDTGYPDRVRRREPGSSSGGLSAHTDSGSVERWLLPAYQRVFRRVFDGRWHEYDPWDGAYRTEVDEYASTVRCSAFRTFQGWTALSDMYPEDGVLHVVPIPEAMAYVLLRALGDDIDDTDLCGATNGQSLPIGGHHSILLPAVSPIPAVEQGDTVWWHSDVIHAVGPVVEQRGWAA